MKKSRAAEIVIQSGWLSRRPEPFQEDVLRRCHLRTFDAGEIVYHAGDPPAGVFGLVEGELQLRLPGNHLATVKSQGYWVGEAAAFRRDCRLATVATATRSHLLHLPAAEFERLITNADYCRYFAILTVEHLEEAVTVITALMAGNPRARIASRLLALMQARSEGAGAPLRVTHAELAAMCALSRQTVNEVVRGLAAEGILTAGYRRLAIRDVETLTKIAAA